VIEPPLASARDGTAAPGFTNPVAARGADPWILRWGGEYLYCRCRRGSIRVSRSPLLHEVCRDPGRVVFTPQRDRPYSCDLWAPELHRIEDRFYIYVAADDGHNRNHRMYVLEGGADPQRPFALKGRIGDASERWAIDGTVLELGSRRYFLWSGWEGERDVVQSLYVAPMSDPWTICGPRVRISTPEWPWERNGRPWVNEGPAVLRSRRGRVFVAYSASGSWTDDYCLGLLTLAGADPLRPDAWRKSATPAFARTGSVFGPGHACFVTSPDGSEDWIVYHAARRRGAGWDRDVRMQRIGWHEDGSPDFGIPVPTGIPVALPAGSRPDGGRLSVEQFGLE
jgi:GH43 family beta-xylosidase